MYTNGTSRRIIRIRPRYAAAAALAPRMPSPLPLPCHVCHTLMILPPCRHAAAAALLLPLLIARLRCRCRYVVAPQRCLLRAMPTLRLHYAYFACRYAADVEPPLPRQLLLRQRYARCHCRYMPRQSVDAAICRYAFARRCYFSIIDVTLRFFSLRCCQQRWRQF